MNQTIEKLKEKFLPEPKFEYETCEEECKHCCHENLGCTIWKEKIEDIRDKVKKIQTLEKQLKNLQEELGLADEEARPKIKEKLEKINKQIEEEKTKITNSKPKVIIIRLKKDTNNETIAHEFTHAFLVWHHCPRGHHGEKYETPTQENSFLFYSLQEFFLQEIEKFNW